jgi:5-aminopentanamidase
MAQKFGAVQLPDTQGDVAASLKMIHQTLAEADNKGLDVVCFPECFLQGYTFDDVQTEERALSLSSPEFIKILNGLAHYRTAIILGFIEKGVDGFYNTAAVIHKGKVIGKYRKTHLFEKNFKPGKTQPVFSANGLTFGINICYDARFPEGPAELAAKGAQAIFYPLNNRLPKETAIRYRDKHIPNLVARAKETGCWIISSDVIANDDTFTGYGYTAIVDPHGSLITKVPDLEVGLIVA